MSDNGPEEAERILWGTRQLAAHFDVPKQVVQKAVREGRIPGSAMVLGRWVFDREVTLASWSPAASRVEDEGRHHGTDPIRKGQFGKGNTRGVASGGGRPKRVFEEKFLRVLVQNVREEDWVEIIAKAVELAKEGNRSARKWLSDYLIGVPVRRVEAKVDVTTRKGFEAGERAAAIQALLQQAQEREEAKIVDAVLREAPIDVDSENINAVDSI